MNIFFFREQQTSSTAITTKDDPNEAIHSSRYECVNCSSSAAGNTCVVAPAWFTVQGERIAMWWTMPELQGREKE